MQLLDLGVTPGLIALAVCAGLGCAPPPRKPLFVVPAAHPDGDTRPLEIRPPADLADNYETAIVRIVADVSAARTVTCTGTLISEDLVLTAHHCVAARDEAGHVTPHDIRPKDLSIELGTTPLPWGDVGVRAIVTPDCGYASGEGDIAVLVLDRKLVGVATIAPRESPPLVGETTTVRAFGRCALSTSPSDPVELASRVGGTVQTVKAGSFEGIASICPGDSGGPVFMKRDGKAKGEFELELVGVVSASVMDGDAATEGYSVFTRIDAWRQLLSAARGIADGATPSELPPYRACEPKPALTESKASSHKSR